MFPTFIGLMFIIIIIILLLFIIFHLLTAEILNTYAKYI